MPTLMDVLRYPCELFCGQMLPWLSWLEREAVDLKVGISSLPGSALETWAVCLSSATEFQDRAIAMALEGCLVLDFTKKNTPEPAIFGLNVRRLVHWAKGATVLEQDFNARKCCGLCLRSHIAFPLCQRMPL